MGQVFTKLGIEPDYNKAMAHMREALMWAAPDDKVKADIKEELRLIAADARDEREHLLKMVSVLYDGLAWGNWPHD